MMPAAPNRPPTESWDDADAYDRYVGRWSRVIGADFLEWLDVPPGRRWLELGCGTGALSAAIVQRCRPSHLLGVDRSPAYVAAAAERVGGERVSFVVADVATLQLEHETFDCITSGLVLNFLRDPSAVLARVSGALARGGQLSAFVWDYAGHYQPMRHFWSAARAVRPDAERLDPAARFTLCREDELRELFASLGLADVEVRSIERVATFRRFDDYWDPITRGQGSVSELMARLTPDETMRLRDRLRDRLPIARDGAIKLVISALAVKGVRA
ncbi:MAG TPA: class I SAM-dependent methyltransferase [Gemmatimonadaceae bacterium]